MDHMDDYFSPINKDVPLGLRFPSSVCPPPTDPQRLACAALHLVGGLLGFVATKSSGFDERTCRTVAIDAGAASGAGHRFFPDVLPMMVIFCSYVKFPSFSMFFI